MTTLDVILLRKLEEAQIHQYVRISVSDLVNVDNFNFLEIPLSPGLRLAPDLWLISPSFLGSPRWAEVVGKLASVVPTHPSAHSPPSHCNRCRHKSQPTTPPFRHIGKEKNARRLINMDWRLREAICAVDKRRLPHLQIIGHTSARSLSTLPHILVDLASHFHTSTDLSRHFQSGETI